MKSFWWLFADFVKTCTVPEFLKLALTHSFPRHPFSNPWKHQKTASFLGVEKGCIGNEWVNYILCDHTAVSQEMLFRNKCRVHLFFVYNFDHGLVPYSSWLAEQNVSLSSRKQCFVWSHSQLVFTCSNLIIENLNKVWNMFKVYKKLLFLWLLFLYEVREPS